jgi:hypothetical protein
VRKNHGAEDTATERTNAMAAGESLWPSSGDGATYESPFPRRYPSCTVHESRRRSTTASLAGGLIHPNTVPWHIFISRLNQPPSSPIISGFLLRTELSLLIEFVHYTSIFNLAIGFWDQLRTDSKIQCI